MTLDLIVPHYDEPWDVGKPFFDMLALQRESDLSEVRVILVDDGGESDVSPQIQAQNYPYEVVYTVIPHRGVSAARNKGLELSNAEWVMFCDFDDLFSSVFSLHCIQDVLDTTKYDLIWWDFWSEMADGEIDAQRGYNKLVLHSKVFRRSMLMEHNLRFNEDLVYSEDTAFLSLLEMEIPFSRIGHSKGAILPYVWTFRKDSVTANNANLYRNNVGLVRRQIYVAEEWLKHGNRKNHDGLCVRALTDAFVGVHRTDVEADRSELTNLIQAFYQTKKKDLAVSKDVVDLAMRTSLRDLRARKAMPASPKFMDWLESLE